MTLTNEIPVNDLIAQVAKELKGIKEIKAPDWASFVKTGAHKQHPPTDKDWWYARSAALLLKIQKLGPIGVEKLRTAYGGRKNRGVKPDRFVKGSGNILRKVMQQLDASGLTRMNDKDAKKGRIITPKGVSFIYAASKKIGGSKAKPKKTKEVVEKKEKKPTQEVPVKEQSSETDVKKEKTTKEEPVVKEK